MGSFACGKAGGHRIRLGRRCRDVGVVGRVPGRTRPRRDYRTSSADAKMLARARVWPSRVFDVAWSATEGSVVRLFVLGRWVASLQSRHGGPPRPLSGVTVRGLRDGAVASTDRGRMTESLRRKRLATRSSAPVVDPSFRRRRGSDTLQRLGAVDRRASVLVATHSFPPASPAGTQTSAGRLGSGVARREEAMRRDENDARRVPLTRGVTGSLLADGER